MTRTARNISISLGLIVVLAVSLLWSPRSNSVHTGMALDSTTPRDSASTKPSHNTRDTASPLYDSANHALSQAAVSGTSDHLIIPVQGETPDKLVDTYTQARANGRVHNAIDIMAPHNTPVLAAASGTIKRFFQSKLGGTTIYELSVDSHTVYYYAHLDHYASGLAEGQQVRQGQVIGYVGDTGDAGPGNYHLHFAIWKIQDPKNFWNGEDLNPYPILRTVR